MWPVIIGMECSRPPTPRLACYLLSIAAHVLSHVGALPLAVDTVAVCADDPMTVEGSVLPGYPSSPPGGHQGPKSLHWKTALSHYTHRQIFGLGPVLELLDASLSTVQLVHSNRSYNHLGPHLGF